MIVSLFRVIAASSADRSRRSSAPEASLGAGPGGGGCREVWVRSWSDFASSPMYCRTRGSAVWRIRSRSRGPGSPFRWTGLSGEPPAVAGTAGHVLGQAVVPRGEGVLRGVHGAVDQPAAVRGRGGREPRRTSVRRLVVAVVEADALGSGGRGEGSAVRQGADRRREGCGCAMASRACLLLPGRVGRGRCGSTCVRRVPEKPPNVRGVSGSWRSSDCSRTPGSGRTWRRARSRWTRRG